MSRDDLDEELLSAKWEIGCLESKVSDLEWDLTCKEREVDDLLDKLESAEYVRSNAEVLLEKTEKLNISLDIHVKELEFELDRVKGLLYECYARVEEHKQRDLSWILQNLA